jgi:hypothetical protein
MSEALFLAVHACIFLSPPNVCTVAILAQGTSWAVAATQAFFFRVQLSSLDNTAFTGSLNHVSSQAQKQIYFM